MLDDMEGFSIADALFQKDLIGIVLQFELWVFNISHRGTFLGVFFFQLELCLGKKQNR